MIYKIKDNMKYAILIFILFAIDVFTKKLVTNKMQVGESIPVIKDFFSITYIRNHGAAFGIFQGKTIFLSVLTIILSLLVLYLLINTDIFMQKIALSMIFAGAIGNIFDRLRYTYVVDMFDFHGIWKFIFNFADICVVLGTFLVILSYIIYEKKI